MKVFVNYLEDGLLPNWYVSRVLGNFAIKVLGYNSRDIAYVNDGVFLPRGKGRRPLRIASERDADGLREAIQNLEVAVLEPEAHTLRGWSGPLRSADGDRYTVVFKNVPRDGGGGCDSVYSYRGHDRRAIDTVYVLAMAAFLRDHHGIHDCVPPASVSFAIDATEIIEVVNSLPQVIKLNTAKNVVTSEAMTWVDPYETPPPRGFRVDVLTWDGVKTDALWGADSYKQFAAWCPKPSMPDWLKKRLHAKFLGKFIPTRV